MQGHVWRHMGASFRSKLELDGGGEGEEEEEKEEEEEEEKEAYLYLVPIVAWGQARVARWSILV